MASVVAVAAVDFVLPEAKTTADGNLVAGALAASNQRSTGEFAVSKIQTQSAAVAATVNVSGADSRRDAAFLS